MEVKLILISGKSPGREIPVPGPEFVVGRAEDCQLRPHSDRVSRRHAAIRVDKGLAAIRDLGSTNGTFVNGEKVEGERELKNGDRVTIGPLEFEVELAVSVGGKRKPKVHSVKEAAARTVETAAEDELDIVSWLDDEEDDEEDEEADAPAAAGPAGKPAADAAPTTRQTEPDSEESPPKTADEEEESQKETKVVGKFSDDKKPVADSSRSAAQEMLKQFFNRP